MMLFFSSLSCAMTYADIPLVIDEKTPNVKNMPPSEKSKWMDIIWAKSITKQSKKEGLVLDSHQKKQAAIMMAKSPQGLMNAVNYYMAAQMGAGEYMYAYALDNGSAVMVVVNENLEQKQLVEQVDIARFIKNYKKSYAYGSCPLIKEVKYPLRIDFFMLGNHQGKDYIFGSFSVDRNYCQTIENLKIQ